MYASGKITITPSSAKTITGLTITGTQNLTTIYTATVTTSDDTETWTASTALSGDDASSVTWSGTATSSAPIYLIYNATKGHARITSITITYAD
ncbi:hypothetical protein [Treponema sp.]|uniref:hypothetical protein n=1 Tax=Treponema sp. TaxID=166 RepID=UPI0025CDE067|nr:hypothetical protein [Treponema sp.]MCR5217746.1 hypothetical protein [Treponema sp.]